MPGKQPVRCRTCFWTGTRATDAPLNSAHPKPCPSGHEVTVGPWPPSAVETTPSGLEIAFWDSENVETGQPQQRRYLVDGERFPSVTTILGILDKSDFLIPWAVRLAEQGVNWRDVRDEAGERGRATHQLVLDVLLGRQRNLSSLTEDHRPYGQAAMKWLMRRSPAVIEAERMVASVEHGYTGRFDLLCRLDADRVRVDFKTVTEWKYRDGKRLPPYPENALQLDLYEPAARESGYEAADYGMVVRLGPDGTFDETPFDFDFDRGAAIRAAYTARSEAGSALRRGPVPPLAVAA